MSDRVDVVVVGAGLAGLAAAYTLAEAGVETVVVERGDYPGSKNVSGGRLYLGPVRPYFPDGFWDEAPFERAVVRERLSMMSEDGSATIDYADRRFAELPAHSVTVLRAKLDRWLADKAGERGALVATGYRVDELVRDGRRVVGVRSGDAEILCNVVIAADGALSFLAEQAGLRASHMKEHFAVAAKEVVELPASDIEDRFGLAPGEGAAQLFFGSISKGLFGGGFLYTNADSLSLGMVAGIRDLSSHAPPIDPAELLGGLKSRPEVASLIRGGTSVEYSAHVIPEGGYAAMPRLFGDGIMLAGDAAGLALNSGLTVRGMDFALASGALAARTVVEAKARGDYSQDSLAAYERHLAASFVLADMKTFAGAPHALDNPRLFAVYPGAATDLLYQVFRIGSGPKARLSSTALREAMRRFANLEALRDALSLRKV